jgi:D-alanine-D-alanine ligase
MTKDEIHIAVVFNEPIAELNEAKRMLREIANHGKLQRSIGELPGVVDLSEVGVIEEREHVEKALHDKGYRTSLFNMNGEIKRLIHFIEKEKPTIVFNLCESLLGQAIHEMHVAGIYELMGMPYTGTGTVALGTCLNKVRTKEILSYHHIPTARYSVIEKGDVLSPDTFSLRYPLIVKPLHEDASSGIENSSVVKDFASLAERAAKVIKAFEQPALVEEYIEGRELNVAVMGNNPPVALPLSEIDFSGLPDSYPKIVTYNAKWVESSPEFIGTVGTCPAVLPPKVEQSIKDIALQAYRIMEVRDYARVDIRLDKNNKPYVLEVNPNPDISRDAGFARSARASGMTFEDMIGKIVEHALERCRIR